MCSLLVTPRSCTNYALPMHVYTVLMWHVVPQAAAGAGLSAGGGGGVGVARPSTWDIVSVMDALASFGVPDSVCDAVGAVVIEAHDDAVPLHCLGHVLLQGGVSPAIALRAVNQLVQVCACVFVLSIRLVCMSLPWYHTSSVVAGLSPVHSSSHLLQHRLGPFSPSLFRSRRPHRLGPCWA